MYIVHLVVRLTREGDDGADVMVSGEERESGRWEVAQYRHLITTKLVLRVDHLRGNAEHVYTFVGSYQATELHERDLLIVQNSAEPKQPLCTFCIYMYMYMYNTCVATRSLRLNKRK